MDEARLWEEESYKRCKDILLTVKTPESEMIKKENCPSSPDSSYSPPQTVVEQSHSTELFHADIKGMLSFMSLCYIARPFHISTHKCSFRLLHTLDNMFS